jgi:uncharacterized coiled-coil DUF342 family protein
VSDQQEQQMVVLLGQINEKVGGIREEMIETRASVRQQGEKIDEIRSEMKAEGLPSRVTLIERDLGRLGRAMWVGLTVVAGLVINAVWKRITGEGDA